MIIIRSLVLLLLVSIIPCSSLDCYECGCEQSDLTSCNCDVITSSTENDYCVILEQRYTDTTYIQLNRVPRNASWVYIEDPYYVLTQESIRYNRTTQQWFLWTSSVVFGCDWDRCNSPDLISALPNSFKLNISTAWLNANIYGTGSVSSCIRCDTEVCGNTSNPSDFSQCPLTSCGNITSCLAYDLWNNVDTGEQCVQAQCAPEYLDGEFGELYGGKFRVDVESVVYLAQDRSKYDIWEIDVYCSVMNCTRPTIFQEVAQQLTLEIGDLSKYPITRPSTTQAPSTTTTPIQNPLRCYSCDCFDEQTCDCSSTVVSSLDYTYCIIVRENFGQETYIYADYLELDATFMYIQEFPYALIEETIDYNEKTGIWFTTTNFVVYGCNWNLCNKASLIPLLPNSFQMRLPEAWLNSSVLGSGLPVRNCHECPDEAQCGTTDFLVANTCPIQSCNTTCLVLDTYDDPEYDYLCYQSFCLPPDTEDYQLDRHRIEIEGIIYASRQDVVHLWEVDIYCRADDCSRPGIFKELHEQLTVQPGTLSALFNETHDPNIPQRRCYDCYCYNKPDCPCNRTTIMNSNETYCLLMRENYGQDSWITLGHLDQDSTRVHIRDFPYLLVEESIIYDEQLQRWNTITNFVVYGCDWDYCNHPSLIPYLPNTFKMRLPDSWLNTNVLGTGQPVRDCHECPEGPQCGTTDFLDPGRCPIKSCNTTCLVFDTFNDPSVDEQCYQSFCAPPDTEDYQIDTHRVEIEGIVYLHKPSREVEIWEIDLYCRADDCSRPEIFTELKTILTVDPGDLSPFDQTTSTSASTSTSTKPSTNPSSMTSTVPGATTTSKASVLTYFNIYLVLLVSIFLFSFH
uniref:Sodefrin repeats C n=1 Tax=Adineta vaga TaxID=104782 RepID=B3G3Z7_ADIVA|nr:sodefrin precursor repeats C [Adineta vaga]